MNSRSLHTGRMILACVLAIALVLLLWVAYYFATANNLSVLVAVLSAFGLVASLGQIVVSIFNRDDIANFFIRPGTVDQQAASSPTGPPTKRKRFFLFFLLTLCTALALSLLSAYVAFTPHTNVVTSVSDNGPGSLRQISQAAKAGDTITFADSLRGGTIILNSDLTINKNIRVLGTQTAEGNSTSVTPSFQDKETNAITFGNANGAKIYIPQGSTVSLEHLNFSGSSPIIQGSFIDNQGNLTLSHCVIVDNHSNSNGGGISNLGGTLTLNDSYVSDNTANSDGSGIYNWSGLLTLNHSTIKNNTTDESGGGIYNLRGTIILINASSINNNIAKAGDGGGIESRNGTLTITGNSEVVDNVATGDGGGIIVVGGQTQLDSTNITRNRASLRGGGIAVEPNTDNGYAGQVTTLNSTIQANHLSAATGSSPDSDIWGVLVTPGSHSSLITSKDTGVQKDIYHPEQQPQYIGTIDIDQYNKYCKQLNPDRYLGASVGRTAFSIYCRTSEDTILLTHLETDPFEKICASVYKIAAPDTVVARLGTYNDPTSWQCYKNETRAGHITTDIASPNVTKLDEFCQKSGYDQAKLLLPNAYGWECYSDNKHDGIGMATACVTEYGANAIDVLTDYDNPNGWECWKPSR